MQDHHISGGRTHQKDAISFRFLDNSHAPFSSPIQTVGKFLIFLRKGVEGQMRAPKCAGSSH